MLQSKCTLQTIDQIGWSHRAASQYQKLISTKYISCRSVVFTSQDINGSKMEVSKVSPRLMVLSSD